ncbi:MAG: nucleotidyltransferase [Ruminococcaceae bacterium]|jgi:NDP-sugar pyrophosphorylase family protein|nr:nucleotidyltransferase [Oscillospiraceae bacterium]
MEHLTLLVLAAGMGSRFGGLKQIEPLGPNGEIIIDYSLHDARLAGFDRVVFVVKPELQETFREVIGDRAAESMEVAYAPQAVDMLPAGFTCPEGRVKPWGTGHAVWCARDVIDGPFGVINADDFYGRDAYVRLAEFLKNRKAGRLCMVGFPLKNTLTDNGTVSRGICRVEGGRLLTVDEHTGIRLENGRIVCDQGDDVPLDAVASMNVWGFGKEVFDRMGEEFARFLRDLPANRAMKGEFYLPSFVDGLIRDREAEVAVLPTTARWYGVTYREDKEGVSAALRAMHESGLYPALR